MRRLAVSLSLAVLVVIVAAVIIMVNLPGLLSLTMSRLTGVQTTVGEANVAVAERGLSIVIRHIRLEGAVAGSVGRVHLILKADRALFERVSVSDFSLAVVRAAGPRKVPWRLIPLRTLLVERGSVTWGTETVEIVEGRLDASPAERSFRFSGLFREPASSATARVSGAGNIRGRQLDMDGEASLRGLSLQRVWGHLEGTADADGRFAYKHKSFTGEGTFSLNGARLRHSFFRTAVPLSAPGGDFSLALSNGTGEMTISGVEYHLVPLSHLIRFAAYRPTGITVSSPFFPAERIAGIVAADRLAALRGQFEGLLDEGRMRIVGLSFEQKAPFRADIEVDGLSMRYGSLPASDIRGRAGIEGGQLSLRGLSLSVAESSFSSISGTISMGRDRTANLKGSYDISLTDVPSLLPGVTPHGVSITAGRTLGIATYREGPGGNRSVAGKGHLQGGALLVGTAPIGIGGSYSFRDGEVTLSPLAADTGGKELILNGTWKRGEVSLAAKGAVNLTALDLSPELGFGLGGEAQVDLTLSGTAGRLALGGSVVMDDMSIEVPGILGKKAGLPASARLSMVREPDAFTIEGLTLSLGSLNANLKGRIGREKISDGYLAVSAERLSDLEVLLGLPSTSAGRLRADLSAREISLPLKDVPPVKGFLFVEGGSFRVPGLPKPVTDADISATFGDEAADITFRGLRCGGSVLSSGSLSILGYHSPVVDLTLDFESLRLSDFQTERDLRLPTIEGESLARRVEGRFHVRAGELDLGHLSATDLEASGTFAKGVLRVAPVTGDLMGGEMDLALALDFNGPEPQVELKGRLEDTKAGIILGTLGAPNSLIEGRTTLSGDLKSAGKTNGELVRNARGEVAFDSGGGSIRRWNLLFKVLSVLNFDLNNLLRDTLKLDREGFPYRMMKAHFSLKDGIAHADEFVIDSPAMLVTATGDINLLRREVDALVALSPFVTFDTALGKIPILGSIFRDKDKGALYFSYLVRGPFDDPAVTLSVAHTLGARTGELLRNLLFLPIGGRP